MSMMTVADGQPTKNPLVIALAKLSIARREVFWDICSLLSAVSGGDKFHVLKYCFRWSKIIIGIFRQFPVVNPRRVELASKDWNE